MKYNAMKLAGILILFCLTLNPLTAERLKVHTFKYVKEVPGWSVQQNSRQSYGSIELDDEINQHSNGYDLRLGIGDRALPYILRDLQLENAGGRRLPITVLFRKNTRYGRELVVELPELPAGHVYQQLQLETPDYFESGLTLYMGSDLERMRYHSHHSLYAYSGGNHKSTISLGARADIRYLRLEVDDSKGVRPLYVISAPETRQLHNKQEIQKDEIDISIDEDAGQTAIYIANPHRRPVQRIQLTFKPRRFSRSLQVYRLDPEDKEYRRYFSSRIQSHSRTGEDAIQNINFSASLRDPIKIEIEDEDNSPLQLEKMTVFTIRQELVFDASDVDLDLEDNLKPELKLYYGNEYIRRPYYELNSTYDEDQSVRRFEIGPERENPEFGYSLVEPPLSSWIIRALFLLGLLLVAFPAYKVIKGLKKEEKGALWYI